MPTDELRYVVRRFNWRWAGNCFVRAPGEHRVAWFDSPDDADADRWRRELEARDRVNPFRCGSAFHNLSTFPEPVYSDWLLDSGVAPPGVAPGIARWADWWDGTKAVFTSEQAARVWDGLNRVRFYDVIARRPSEAAYAVVRVMWGFDDSTFDTGAEGGLPVAAFRTREKAEARCREMERTARERWGAGGRFQVGQWDGAAWPAPAGWCRHADSPDGAPFFEVVEIDLGPGGS